MEYFFLTIGILGIAVFKKDTVIECLEIAAAWICYMADCAWKKLVG